MSFMGGGESLCCESILALLSGRHEMTILSESFDPHFIEKRFGFEGLFDRVNLLLYSSTAKAEGLGSYSHLLKHLRGQKGALKRAKSSSTKPFDIIFSTQDEGYIPDMNLPVVQWGYFPRTFPNYFPRALPKAIRILPLRLYYERKVSRIGLLLAISQYSKWHFDREWKRPSALVYPSCRMVKPGAKQDVVVTAARASPEKRLELFWKVARTRPQYQFVMLLTRNPALEEYSRSLSNESPSNGRTIFNASRETYQRILGEARVYIHLMEDERFGITIVEAMSAGCVPVVHDSGAPREIVDSEVGFRWKEMEDLPKIIDKAMEQSPSTRSRKTAEQFNYSAFEKRLSSIFSELKV